MGAPFKTGDFGGYYETLAAVRTFAADRLDSITNELAKWVLDLKFYTEPSDAWLPAQRATHVLEAFAYMLGSSEFRHSPNSVEFLTPFGLALPLGKTVSDEDLKEFRFIRVHASGLAEPANRARDCMNQYNRRCTPAIRFRMERREARRKDGENPSPGAYVLHFDEVPADRILGSPEARTRYRDLHGNSYPELQPLRELSHSTDAPSNFTDSVLCSGTLLRMNAGTDEGTKNVLILPAQQSISVESLTFHWLRITVPSEQELTQDKIRLIVEPPSCWRLSASPRVRLGEVDSALMGSAILGEPISSISALAEHLSRIHNQEPVDIFYKLSFEPLRGILGERIPLPIHSVLIAFEGSRWPQSYSHQQLTRDLPLALNAACDAAGERKKQSKDLSDMLTRNWVRTAWRHAVRVEMPSHGPVTDDAYDRLAEKLRSTIEQMEWE